MWSFSVVFQRRKKEGKEMMTLLFLGDSFYKKTFRINRTFMIVADHFLFTILEMAEVSD